jgi:hypothetical protein
MGERGLYQPPAMALATMGRRDGEKIGDRGAGDDPAEKKAHRQPGLADHKAAIGPAGEAAADPGLLLLVRDLIGDEGVGVEAIQAERAAGDGDAGSKVGGRRQIDSRYRNSPSGEIAGQRDQAFDAPEARGFEGQHTVRVSRGNATGAERDILADPGLDQLRERLCKALCTPDLQAIDRAAEDFAVEILPLHGKQGGSFDVSHS